eukprot:GHVR01121380.1.p1 GENE.GHVR01121380.1~~GHVR01121380.1.p1  ORF type:complete len:431 (+),score=112.50 GHVR01121380.1:29-1321(+)
MSIFLSTTEETLEPVYCLRKWLKEQLGEEIYNQDERFLLPIEKDNLFKYFELFIHYSNIPFKYITTSIEEDNKNNENNANKVEGNALFVRDPKIDLFGYAEGYFTIMFNMLEHVDSEKIAQEGLKMLSETIMSGKDHPDLRLRILMSIFNMLNPNDKDDKDMQPTCFKRVLKYSLDNNKFHAVHQYVPSIDVWMEEGDLTSDDKADIYSSLVKGLRSLGKISSSMKAARKLMCALDSMTTENRKMHIDATVELCVESLGHSDCLTFDELLRYTAVQELKDTEHASLVALVELFFSGSLNDFIKFKDDSVFEKYGLKKEALRKKIMLLDMANAVQTRKDVPLSDIANTLQVNVDEAEGWVVDAIMQRLLDARIDQSRGVVVVKSAFQRTFAEKEWERLRLMLTHWCNSVDHLKKCLNDNKMQQQNICVDDY